MGPVVGLDDGTQNVEPFAHHVEARPGIAAEIPSLTRIANDDADPAQKSEWCLEAVRECFIKLDADFHAPIVASGQSPGQRQSHAK